MRSMSLALAVAFASTWTAAHGSEAPGGSKPSAATSTGVSIALLSPSGAAISDRADAPERSALSFTLRGPAPVPLAKPRLPRFQPPRETICGIIETAAEEHELPVGFLTRLIWQESRFRVTAVSHAGAQGIAQFMPATAAERELENPFDPEQALWAAASLLSSLKQRFGNLGLAAAAYNAGPKRVSDWLRKKRRLPAETRHYVKAITGQPASSWAKSAGTKAPGVLADDTVETGCVLTVVAMADGG